MTKERLLTKEEKSWKRKLKKILKDQPSTLIIRQSNIDSSLAFYDKKTGKEISFIGQTITGFLECDHKEQIKVSKYELKVLGN